MMDGGDAEIRMSSPMGLPKKPAQASLMVAREFSFQTGARPMRRDTYHPWKMNIMTSMLLNTSFHIDILSQISHHLLNPIASFFLDDNSSHFSPLDM